MDEQIRAAAAETLSRAIETALKLEHRFDLPPSWRETIKRVSAEHVVVVIERPLADPDATTVRITPADLGVGPETDPAELEDNYPRPGPHTGVKRKG